jgi:hypothetical protein
MEQTTLDIAKRIVQFLDDYRGPMELEALLEAAILSTNCPRQQVIEVIDFLNSLKGAAAVTVPHKTQALAIVPDKPLDLMDELHYSYYVAKKLLTDELQKTTHDAEEVRKNLREISRFMESALKLQERLFNAQQIQRFQDAVFAVLDSVDPTLRELVVQELARG